MISVTSIVAIDVPMQIIRLTMTDSTALDYTYGMPVMLGMFIVLLHPKFKKALIAARTRRLILLCNLPLVDRGGGKPAMKINPRYYPAIIIAAYVIFLLLGILLGFGPERGGESHGKSALMQLALMTLEILS